MFAEGKGNTVYVFWINVECEEEPTTYNQSIRKIERREKLKEIQEEGGKGKCVMFLKEMDAERHRYHRIEHKQVGLIKTDEERVEGHLL